MANHNTAVVWKMVLPVEKMVVPAEVVVVVMVAKEPATTVVVAEAATEAMRMDPPT